MRRTLRQSLAGRHALVTGGSRGIGAAIADRLAAQGAAVTVVGRAGAAVEAKVTEPVAAGANAAGEIADVTDARAGARAFRAAAARLRPVTILINNAGGATSAPFAGTTPARRSM